MKIKNNIRNWIKYGVLIAYSGLMVYFLFFAELFGRTSAAVGYRYNLVPLKEIKRYIAYYNQLGAYAVGINIIGNIIAFVPLGILLPVFSRKRLRFVSVLLLTFMFSLVIELIQLVSKVGSFDVDDIILNTLGGIIGYLLYFVWKTVTERKKRRV